MGVRVGQGFIPTVFASQSLPHSLLLCLHSGDWGFVRHLACVRVALPLSAYDLAVRKIGPRWLKLVGLLLLL